MQPFCYFQPTEIRFGRRKAHEAGEVTARLGTRALIVTEPAFREIEPIHEKVSASLRAANLEVAHFDGVAPNPTTEVVAAGTRLAREHGSDVVVGLGGGSSMDTAKAIAVEATHEGTCWDRLWFRDEQPTEATLPVVAVTTTSGTGSHVTQVSVVTNSAERCKSALYNALLFPRVAIVDPELMASVPPKVTAATGFDAFTHAFEAYIHAGTSPFVEILAKEAIRLVAQHLPTAVRDGADIGARDGMAWADTLAGLCIASAGVTLPHGMGMAVGGMYPHVAHGEALAALYPAFVRFTWETAVPRFATLGRIFDANLREGSDEEAARGAEAAVTGLLDTIGLRLSLRDFDVPEAELDALAEACLVLPDYENNPRVATLEYMLGILRESHV